MKRERMKKLVIYIGALVVMASIGFAAWTIYAGSTVTGSVTSIQTSPLQVYADFSDFEINTTTAAQTLNSTMTVYNGDGNMNLTATLTVDTTDFGSDSCTDYQNDCNMTFWYKGAEIKDQDSVIITSGYSDVTAKLACDWLSCPQNVTGYVSFE